MTQSTTRQRLIILAAMISAGMLANTGIASAADEDSNISSRMEMIIEKLTPDNQSFARSNSNLSKRLVMSQDGIGELNVLINEKHSLDLSVLFAPESAALTSKARALLKDLGEALRADQLSEATYLIGGHTDASGNAEQNRKLSEQRARSVKTFLVNSFGIDPNRLVTAGYGDDRLADEDNPEAQINRRIEISLISTGYKAPKKRIAKITTARVQPTSGGSAYRFGARNLRPMPVGYQINRRFDDYNSDIFNPPTITGMYATAHTGNVVCDSFEGLLTDPRPRHMELDDYDARTPTTCPAASEYRATYKNGGFGPFSPEDDNELLK